MTEFVGPINLLCSSQLGYCLKFFRGPGQMFSGFWLYVYVLSLCKSTHGYWVETIGAWSAMACQQCTFVDIPNNWAPVADYFVKRIKYIVKLSFFGNQGNKIHVPYLIVALSFTLSRVRLLIHLNWPVYI